MDKLISSFSMKENTLIGTEGISLSQGQKQRLIIARAIYKNPNYLMLDEATSFLDTINESQILDNIINTFKQKTIIMITHKLHGIEKSDQIIVLENGEILGSGTHDFLIAKCEKYNELYYNYRKQK